jgi:tRNA(fMet)-specific endonuclease VapC
LSIPCELPLGHRYLHLGELKAQLRQAGQLVADFDLLIASIALTEERTLVTNNIRHYNRIIGLNLENWI